MAALTITQLISAATPEDFEAKILSIGVALGLKTRAWQSGGITRTIIKIMSQVLGLAAGKTLPDSTTVDGLVSTYAHAGFLKFASSVTDDPSVALSDGTFPQPTGWLHILADSVYNVQVIEATFATAPVDLVNASTSTYGPFAVGTYHIVNPITKKTYKNVAVLTINPSATTLAVQFIADVAGAASSGAASSCVPSTSLVGVTVSGASTGVFTGQNAESNADLVDRCLDKLAALGPKVGPDGAYTFFAKSATLPTTDLGGGGLTLAGGAITRVHVRLLTGTGVVEVYLANANGAPSGPDLALVNTYLHSVCVPDAVSEITYAATEVLIAVAITVSVRSAYSALAAGDVALAIQNYINTLPIGGVDIDGLGNLGVPIETVEGAVFANSKASDGTAYIENVLALTLNAGTSSIALTFKQVAKVSPAPVVTVTVVA